MEPVSGAPEYSDGGETANTTERLSSTLFIAVLFHGIVILGVTFSVVPLNDDGIIPTLRVTLVQPSPNDHRVPDDDVYLAQRSQIGAAGAAAGNRPTTTLAADQIVTQQGTPLGLDARDGTPRDLETSADRLVTRNESALQLDAIPEPTDEAANERRVAANLLSRDADQTLAAEIDLQAQMPETAGDGEYIGPNTRESVLAVYLDGWRQRVERIGTINFPTEALDRGFDNNPTLEVTIDPDGRLARIVVRRSSGNEALDQAALTILRAAAPFEPLPADIRAEYDVLRFAYEWDFGNALNAASR
jgi:protein TonB